MKINGKSDREKDEEKENKVKQILDCMEVYMPLCIHYKYSKTPGLYMYFCCPVRVQEMTYQRL